MGQDFINKENMERQITEMWQAVNDTVDPHDRDIASSDAQKTEQELRERYRKQELLRDAAPELARFLAEIIFLVAGDGKTDNRHNEIAKNNPELAQKLMAATFLLGDIESEHVKIEISSSEVLGENSTTEYKYFDQAQLLPPVKLTISDLKEGDIFRFKDEHEPRIFHPNQEGEAWCPMVGLIPATHQGKPSRDLYVLNRTEVVKMEKK